MSDWFLWNMGFQSPSGHFLEMWIWPVGPAVIWEAVVTTWTASETFMERKS